jgi:hypothetical protein
MCLISQHTILIDASLHDPFPEANAPEDLHHEKGIE